jgi:hypothetical protein
MFEDLVNRKNRVHAETKRYLNTMAVLDEKLSQLYGWDFTHHSSENSGMTYNSPRTQKKGLDFSIENFSNISDIDESSFDKHSKENFIKLREDIFWMKDGEVTQAEVEKYEEELKQKYDTMKALAQEKWDIAHCAVKLYEDELKELDQKWQEVKISQNEEIEPSYEQPENGKRGRKGRKRAKKSKRKAKGKKRDRKLVTIKLDSGENRAMVGELKNQENVLNNHCIWKSEKLDNMIACDNPNCKIEWYHYSCVGVTEHPKDDEHWICPFCKINSENKKHFEDA